MVNFTSKSVIYKQPRGTVLIIGAWNYPVYLTFMPLVGALSAGNTVVLKPSDMSPITTSVIGEIIASAFRPEYITVVVDRKSTRLNSSHVAISYAVFCLKKKK